MNVGEVICAPGSVVLNEGRATVEVDVANVGDRPVQVGSHLHFFEANSCLSFDRAARSSACGSRPSRARGAPSA